MAVENLFGSLVMTNVANTTPSRFADVSLLKGRVRTATDRVEVDAAASANSTYTLARIPMAAIIQPQSQVYWDDLASSGAPTFDIGLFAADGQSGVTDDDDAINDGLDAATARTSGAFIKDPVNIGKRVYELLGLTEDPGGNADIKLTLKDAAVNTGGTVALSLQYVVD